MADTQKFLKFKMGEYKNLASATKSAGTVYVTTDERAMYVDISDSQRIRLQGTVLYYNSLTEFSNKVTPPYSTDIIYFIANENALVRWDANADNGKGGKGAWIQLNTTATDVNNAVAALTAAVNKNAGDIKDNSDAIAENAKDIAALETAVGAEGLGGRVSALEAALGVDSGSENSVSARLDAVEGEITDAKSRLDVVEKSVEDVEKVAADNQDAISDLSAALGNDASGLTKRVKDLEGEMDVAQEDIDDLEEKVGVVEGKVSTLETAVGASGLGGRVSTLEGQMQDANDGINAINTDLTNNYVKKTEHSNDINAINDAIGSDTAAGTIKNRIKVLEGEMDAAEGEIRGIKTEIGTMKTNIQDNHDLISGFQTTVANTYVTKTTHSTDMGNVNGRIDNISTNLGSDFVEGKTVTGRVKALESDMSTAKSDISTLKTNVQDAADAASANATEIGKVKTRLDAAEGTIKNHTTAINGLDTTVGGHTTTLGQHATAISGLTTDLGTANGKIKDNADAIGDINAAIGTDATSGTVKGRIAALEASIGEGAVGLAGKVSTLEGKMSAAEGKITAAEGKITTLEGEMDAVEGDIDDINDTIATLATKEALNQAKTDLSADINAHIKAANAMRYMGGVDGETKVLPTTGVKVGDTYVVTKAFGSYLPGDLLVAKGTETGEGDAAVITSGLAWEHVSTGYDAFLENKLEVKNNTINLLNYADNAISGVVFTTDAAKSVSISTNAAGDSINLSIEWGSF